MKYHTVSFYRDGQLMSIHPLSRSRFNLSEDMKLYLEQKLIERGFYVLEPEILYNQKSEILVIFGDHVIQSLDELAIDVLVDKLPQISVEDAEKAIKMCDDIVTKIRTSGRMSGAILGGRSTDDEDFCCNGEIPGAIYDTDRFE